MKRRSIALMLVAVLLLHAPAALASYVVGGVWATPRERLAFRTGPGTQYGELYTLPMDTAVVAIETEYGNDVPWVLCEFQFQGRRVRAYTGLKRFSLQDDIAAANHAWLNRRLVYDADILDAPDLNAGVRGFLSAGERVEFLGFEGDYCFIEYDDGDCLNRGYIREECFMPDLGEFEEYFPDNPGMTLYVIKPSAYLYAEPSEGAEVLFSMPFDASCDWEFDSAVSGRTPTGWVALYYGGLLGFGRSKDFSDLRFEDPESARETLTVMGEYED